MPTTYKTNLESVDWEELKQTLSQDNFDNGRSPQQLEQSFANSHATCIAYVDCRIIGTARVLSDGVCNAYLVDVWTLTAFRRQGIARTMIEMLLEGLQGQHVYLFTDDSVKFYQKAGFVERPTGMERVVGEWLVNNNPVEFIRRGREIEMRIP
jgi:ribosomal protein S18 acetylase RimI-like enzyme